MEYNRFWAIFSRKNDKKGGNGSKREDFNPKRAGVLGEMVVGSDFYEILSVISYQLQEVLESPEAS